MKYENLPEVMRITDEIKKYEALLTELRHAAGVTIENPFRHHILDRKVFSADRREDYFTDILEAAVEKIREEVTATIEQLKNQLTNL